MVFSSPVFLFVFLPLVLLAYASARPAWRNAILLFFSLLFYAWGETVYVVLMLGSIGFNYSLGRRIRNLDNDGRRKRLVAVGVTGNLALLGAFKYAGFFLGVIRDVWVFAGGTPFPVPQIHLPIGISFFTFQAMSYLIDIYRRVEGGTTRFVDCALYISLFPQLIAGPIVRYHQIAGQIRSRRHSLERFSRGVERFITGLAKKIILADSAGYIADKVFEVPVSQVTTSMAWLGLAAYTLQIYFDFSGYSDMAIGLGRFFGFELPENFNFPYISRSIREFWRRWHISLSTWFRDYLYYPLGGNRIGPGRTYINLWIVFVLCGLWHGAGWNFIVWGTLHGVYLVIERLGWERVLARLWRPLQHIYVISLVMIGWVFFRTRTPMDAVIFLKRLAGLDHGIEMPSSVLTAYDPGRLLLLLAGAVFCMPAGRWIMNTMDTLRWDGAFRGAAGIRSLYYLVLWVLFVLCAAFAAANTYQPFIYFRF